MADQVQLTQDQLNTINAYLSEMNLPNVGAGGVISIDGETYEVVLA
jgi:hypothetical protein